MPGAMITLARPPRPFGRHGLRRAIIAGVLLLGAIAVGPRLVPRRRLRDAAALASELGIEGRLVHADGIRVWVAEVGPPDGPPVVLIHGFGGWSWEWRETMPVLAAAGYRAIAPDLANFGLSEKSWDRDTTHERQAALVAAVMAILGIDSATFVVHSMGANVAAWLAVRRPERVARALLVDAATGAASEPRGAAAAALLLHLPGIRRLGRLALWAFLDDARMGAILRSAYADPSRVSATTLAGYVAPLHTPGWDLGLLAIVRDGAGNRLRAPLDDLLRVPTAIVWGRQDRWIPLAAGSALRAALPGCEWHIVEDAGHLPMEEQPAAFNAVLLDWLERTG